MENPITHNSAEHRFFCTEEGHVAYVEYTIEDATLVIHRTVVPTTMGGRGVAAQLVQAAYEYADTLSLRRAATCTYALGWLRKNCSSLIAP